MDFALPPDVPWGAPGRRQFVRIHSSMASDSLAAQSQGEFESGQLDECKLGALNTEREEERERFLAS